ncbi:hypothetical protein PCE1_001711 [Barthelona sp. PCE]
MRLVLQRVDSGSVTVSGEISGAIEKGIAVLVGFTSGDSEEDFEWASKKILDSKIFQDDQQRSWRASVRDLNIPVLIVSQFTLYTIWGGKRPKFHRAMAPTEAQELYNKFIEYMRGEHSSPIETGQFGEYMDIDLHLSGPVTMTFDSRQSVYLDDLTDEQLEIVNPSYLRDKRRKEAKRVRYEQAHAKQQSVAETTGVTEQ